MTQIQELLSKLREEEAALEAFINKAEDRCPHQRCKECQDRHEIYLVEKAKANSELQEKRRLMDSLQNI
jgi:hypothetical protein